MSTPIVEKILGNNILANNYIRDTLNLTKSINIKNDNEAKSYNELIKQKGIDGTIATIKAKGLKKVDAVN